MTTGTRNGKPRKPRIITLTVRRMRAMAADKELCSGKGASLLARWASELSDTDARETRPDPSKRRRKAARAKRA